MNGLILEGGGMRGAFTAGVLDAFLEKELYFDYVCGVSAGASNGASYISRQKGRNRKIFVEKTKEFSYFSLKHFPKQKSFLDIRLLFDTYPNKLVPFDYKTFDSNPALFKVCLTDCETGKPEYVERHSVDHEEFMMKILAGSNSLPLVSPPVQHMGRKFLDGGLSDSIPAEKAFEDGCRKCVVILTREDGYRKKPSKSAGITSLLYNGMPGVGTALKSRHLEYNRSLDYCEKQERSGMVFRILPDETMDVGRTESDFKKLDSLYRHGYEKGLKLHPSITEFLFS